MTLPVQARDVPCSAVSTVQHSTCGAGWLALFFGATLLSRWHVAALLLVLLAARVGLHALHDQRAAHRLHAQMLGLCYAAIPALLVASEYRGEGSLRMATGEPLNLGLVSCILVLMSLYARQTGMGEAARLGLEAAVAACAFVAPRLTAGGHPLEALCAAATFSIWNRSPPA